MVKNKKIFIVKLLLVIMWLGVIFCFSSANSTETSNQSFGLSKLIVKFSLTASNYVHITNIELNDSNIREIASNIHPYLRKIAHFLEFFILSILVLLAIKETDLNYNYSFTLLFCFLIAILDETHQLFVDGRAGQIKDVFIDSSGSLLYIIINKIYNYFKK